MMPHTALDFSFFRSPFLKYESRCSSVGTGTEIRGGLQRRNGDSTLTQLRRLGKICHYVTPQEPTPPGSYRGPTWHVHKTAPSIHIIRCVYSLWLCHAQHVPRLCQVLPLCVSARECGRQKPQGTDQSSHTATTQGARGRVCGMRARARYTQHQHPTNAFRVDPR